MRALVGLRAVAGAVLLVAPGQVLGDLPHRRIDGGTRAFVRVLGARHLAEAAVLWRHDTHRWVLAGAAVDATHAATMLVLAAIRPNDRRLALVNSLTASVLAGAGVVASQRRVTLLTFRQKAA